MKDISQAAAALGKRGGSVTSDRKAAASRENGKKGGAPRKWWRQCDNCGQLYPSTLRGLSVCCEATTRPIKKK